MWMTDRLTQVLITVCVVVWVASAISPWDRQTWFLEQMATFVSLLVLVACLGKVSFSSVSKLGIAALICIHSVGTHYTYSLTPYDELYTWLFGFSFDEWVGWERNNYDRFVHFAYGVCLAQPFKEAFVQIAKTTSGTASFISFHVVLSTSAVYELIEWSAAVLFGDGAGMAYLGIQGDIWDAQADIALAGAGWLVVYGSISGCRMMGWALSKGSPRSD